MTDTARTLLENFCCHAFESQNPCWFYTDRDGGIQEFGGNLSALGLKTPAPGEAAEDVLIFMEALLPLTPPSMSFSCIKLPGGSCINARVFGMDAGWGILVWNAEKEDELLTQTQQKCNELSLLIERNKRQMARYRDPQPFLGALFRALNMAVLETNEKGGFVLIGTPPPWFEHIAGAASLQAGMPHGEDDFSFLGNFIKEARTRWTAGDHSEFRSGTWIEQDRMGQDIMFDAIALDILGRKMILISNDTCSPQDKQSIIQKGRNLALHYQDLQRSDRKLQSLHDDLTRQLRQSRKMEAIGTLAGGIAHDFNNILAAIIGFSELSLLNAGDNTHLAGMQQNILTAANRAKDLVRQILTFSRKTEQKAKPVQPGDIITEVTQLIRASIPAAIDIKTRLSGNAYILADPTQMHQVLMNLCTNAWYAMEKGPGTLTVTAQEIDLAPDDLITLPELTPGHHVMITVGDTGCGMSKELMDRIFDPYFTTREKNKGTGLGLSVVHGIVTQTGGCIRVASQSGKGSRFSLYFPALRQSGSRDGLREPTHTGKGEQILFVDDDPFQTEIAVTSLTRLGYRVTSRKDGKEALDLFKENPDRFHLAILDMIMPKMTGKALGEKLLRLRAGLPVILCTGYSEEVKDAELKKKGFSRILIKPVGLRDLARAVAEALGSSA